MTDEQALKIINCMDTLGNAQLEAALDVAAEALRERIERRNGGWISVKDRLPDTNGRYLVSLGTVAPESLGGNSTRIRIIRYIDGEWKCPVHLPTWINEEITQEVTHWQPLPQPPQKGE